MSNVTNLTRARKQKAREDALRQADANAARFGRTRAQKAAEAAEAARSDTRLDAHRRDD